MMFFPSISFGSEDIQCSLRLPLLLRSKDDVLYVCVCVSFLLLYVSQERGLPVLRRTPPPSPSFLGLCIGKGKEERKKGSFCPMDGSFRAPSIQTPFYRRVRMRFAFVANDIRNERKDQESEQKKLSKRHGIGNFLSSSIEWSKKKESHEPTTHSHTALFRQCLIREVIEGESLGGTGSSSLCKTHTLFFTDATTNTTPRQRLHLLQNLLTYGLGCAGSLSLSFPLSRTVQPENGLENKKGDRRGS